jgi:hypothetical protein
MGNAHQKWIAEEFNNIKKEKTNPIERDNDYLTLEDVMKFKPPRETPLDMSHLGTLFVMDKQKDGKFDLKELSSFVALYHEHQANDRGTADFLKEFQGYCTLQMWNFVAKPDGRKAWVNWFCSLLVDDAHCSFVHRDAVKLVHQILNVRRAYGVDFQNFFNLLQRAAIEQNLMPSLQDAPDREQLEECVPMQIIRKFASDFIEGFANYMLSLGFSADLE